METKGKGFWDVVDHSPIFSFFALIAIIEGFVEVVNIFFGKKKKEIE